MRRNLLLVLALFTSLCISVNAEITPAQQTDPEILINNGYSESFAEDVFVLKNRSTGKPCEPLYEKKHTWLVRFVRKCYQYIDPSLENEERYHHDIQGSPHYKDL